MLIHFHLYSGNAEDVTERLDKGILDFGILIQPVDIMKYNSIRLPDKVVWGVIMRKNTPLAAKRSITRRDLSGLPLICSRQAIRHLPQKNEYSEWFEEAVREMNIVATYHLISKAALMVGIAQILAVQILTPLKKDNVLLLASVVGAVAGISLNLVLVPCLHSIGTAVVLLCSETAVTCVYIVYVLRHSITPLHAGIIGRSLLTVLPAAAIWAAAAIFIDHPLLSIASGAAVGAPVWYIINSRTRGSALKLLIKKRND